MLFPISRYEYSATGRRRGLNNTAPADVRAHLQETDVLVAKAQASWNAYCRSHGYPATGIMITSGYRSPAVNSAVGGAAHSAHKVGYAADTQPNNGQKNAYLQWAQEFARSGVRFDQIIAEGVGSSKWVHIAVKSPSGAQRMMAMTYDGKKYRTTQVGTPTAGTGDQGITDYGESGGATPVDIDANEYVITDALKQEMENAKNTDWNDNSLYDFDSYDPDATYDVFEVTIPDNIKTQQAKMNTDEPGGAPVPKPIVDNDMKPSIDLDEVAGPMDDADHSESIPNNGGTWVSGSQAMGEDLYGV